MLSYRARIGATTMVLAGIGLLAAGCGGSSGSPAAPAPTASGGAFAAYTDCLAQNGVTLPARSPGARPSGQPGGGGGGGAGGGGFGNQKPAGVDQATWDKAQQACASTRPTGGPGGGGAGGGNSAMVAYRTCLSDHGVTLTGGPGQLNTADPATAAAMTACAALRPTGGPSPAN